MAILPIPALQELGCPGWVLPAPRFVVAHSSSARPAVPWIGIAEPEGKVVFELGALAPYSNQVQRGYYLASFVPTRPRLGRQFTTSVFLNGQDKELFSFTVPIKHETLSAIEPEDARSLEEATNAVLAALPPSSQYDESTAKSALAKSPLPNGVELSWP